MITIKKTISEMWEGTRESRESKTGLVLLTFMSILTYAGVMALAYTIVGKPVFAVTYTNAFAATCVIFWRRRNSAAPMIKKQRIPTMECALGLNTFAGRTTLQGIVDHEVEQPTQNEQEEQEQERQS